MSWKDQFPKENRYFETENGILYCGDCLEIMKKFPKESVDLVLTDPPYGVGLNYGVYKDTEENWYKLMNRFIPESIRIGRMVILPSCQIKRLKWIYQNFPPDWLICWYKGSPGHASFIGFNDWEPHLVYGRTKKRLYMHDYFQTKVSIKKGTFGHPCPKPMEWAEWLIEKSTREGNLILDPFLGSGTTAVACEKLNRRWVGIELEEKYCGIAKRRIEEVINQKGMF
jgi:DNA modification methylase